MPTKKPIIVVAGLDEDQRPHAARFEPSEETLATKAAALMGLKIGFAQDAKAQSVARSLPKGRLFTTGRGLVPYVKHEVYEELNTLIAFETAMPLEEPAPTNAPPADGSVAIGAVVLALDNEGWWEAIVLEIDDKKDKVTLRWRDWPQLKAFSRPVSELAIMGAASLRK